MFLLARILAHAYVRIIFFFFVNSCYFGKLAIKAKSLELQAIGAK